MFWTQFILFEYFTHHINVVLAELDVASLLEGRVCIMQTILFVLIKIHKMKKKLVLGIGLLGLVSLMAESGPKRTRLLSLLEKISDPSYCDTTICCTDCDPGCCEMTSCCTTSVSCCERSDNDEAAKSANESSNVCSEMMACQCAVLCKK